MTYKLKISLLSDTIIGSSEGYSVIVDTDIVYDEYGFPYIPAKRIKGILRDSADELISYFDSSNIGYKIEKDGLFGKSGWLEGNIVLSDFYIEEYEKNKEWIKYLSNKQKIYNVNISQQNVLNTFTTIRIGTSIDKEKGISKKGSLRKFRCLKAGLDFYGKIDMDEKYEEQLALICQNVRSIGTKRNRGFGRVSFTLYKNGEDINKKALENFEKEVIQNG